MFPSGRSRQEDFLSFWIRHRPWRAPIRRLRNRLVGIRDRLVIDSFHRLYYDAAYRGGTWTATSWMGVKTLKCPLDLWIYQEIIHETRPELIIECGTASGGSALYLASICDMLNHGRIVTIDIRQKAGRPRHPRITYLTGSSVDPGILESVAAIAEGKTTMVVLDSDHHAQHVLAELRAYSRFIKAGGYLIVEDTNINGHPVLRDFGLGPMEATKAFLAEAPQFAPDRSREKLYLTFNPGGYLRRI